MHINIGQYISYLMISKYPMLHTEPRIICIVCTELLYFPECTPDGETVILKMC